MNESDVISYFPSHYPQGTFHFAVFIPSKDKDNNSIDQAFWVDEILALMGRLFRGATAYPRGRGVWRLSEAMDDVDQAPVDKSDLIFDDTVTIFTYASREEVTPDSCERLARILRRMGRETRQGEVGLVVQAVYIGITDFEDAP